MRKLVLRVGLAVATAASATAFSAGSASATVSRPNLTYWAEVGRWVGPGAWNICDSRGRADVADPNNNAIAYSCNGFTVEWSPGVYRTGFELDELFSGGT
jgi:hypothetical protein